MNFPSLSEIGAAEAVHVGDCLTQFNDHLTNYLGT